MFGEASAPKCTVTVVVRHSSKPEVDVGMGDCGCVSLTVNVPTEVALQCLHCI